MLRYISDVGTWLRQSRLKYYIYFVHLYKKVLSWESLEKVFVNYYEWAQVWKLRATYIPQKLFALKRNFGSQNGFLYLFWFDFLTAFHVQSGGRNSLLGSFLICFLHFTLAVLKALKTDVWFSKQVLFSWQCQTFYSRKYKTKTKPLTSDVFCFLITLCYAC